MYSSIQSARRLSISALAWQRVGVAARWLGSALAWQSFVLDRHLKARPAAALG